MSLSLKEKQLNQLFGKFKENVGVVLIFFLVVVSRDDSLAMKCEHYQSHMQTGDFYLCLGEAMWN